MHRPSFAFGAVFTCFLCATQALADHDWNNRDVNAGQQLYAENCASCHGVNLEGQQNWQTPNQDGVLPAPPHDQNGHTWHHDNKLLFDYTKRGGRVALALRGLSDFNSGMQGFGDTLSDAEIWDILAYIRSTWPEQIRTIQNSQNPAH